MRASILIATALAIHCFGSARAEDCLSRALARSEGRRGDEAVEALRKGAREGDERCQFVLGMWSLAGTHMEQDLGSAVRWLQKAAGQGLPVAQSSLGMLYASGVGVETNAELAARWYRRAADSGDPVGQAELGALTFLGLGVPRSPVDGYVWTSLAARQGNETARRHLPRMQSGITEGEVEQAKARVAAFRPKQSRRQRPLSQRDLLRAVGLRGRPTEYERLFGY